MKLNDDVVDFLVHCLALLDLQQAMTLWRRYLDSISTIAGIEEISFTFKVAALRRLIAFPWFYTLGATGASGASGGTASSNMHGPLVTLFLDQIWLTLQTHRGQHHVQSEAITLLRQCMKRLVWDVRVAPAARVDSKDRAASVAAQQRRDVDLCDPRLVKSRDSRFGAVGLRCRRVAESFMPVLALAASSLGQVTVMRHEVQRELLTCVIFVLEHASPMSILKYWHEGCVAPPNGVVAPHGAEEENDNEEEAEEGEGGREGLETKDGRRGGGGVGGGGGRYRSPYTVRAKDSSAFLDTLECCLRLFEDCAIVDTDIVDMLDNNLSAAGGSGTPEESKLEEMARKAFKTNAMAERAESKEYVPNADDGTVCGKGFRSSPGELSSLGSFGSSFSSNLQGGSLSSSSAALSPNLSPLLAPASPSLTPTMAPRSSMNVDGGVAGLSVGRGNNDGIVNERESDHGGGGGRLPSVIQIGQRPLASFSDWDSSVSTGVPKDDNAGKVGNEDKANNAALLDKAARTGGVLDAMAGASEAAAQQWYHQPIGRVMTRRTIGPAGRILQTVKYNI
jgi:hypothetical protein